MSVRTQVIQRAYADLLDQVFLRLRNGKIIEAQQLHDLGDALHTISGILVEYASWIDDQEFRRLYLRRYDALWASKGLALERFLDERIQYHSSPQCT